MKTKIETVYRLFAILCVLFLLNARPAHAYLDPGTGSYATQIILASLVGVLFSIKLIFRGIVDFFRKNMTLSKSGAATPVVATTPVPAQDDSQTSSVAAK